MKNGQKLTICIVTPSRSAYSETFIKAHIERLPARVITLQPDWLGRTEQFGLVSFQTRLLLRVLRKLAQHFERVLRRESHFTRLTDILTFKYILQHYQIDVVLAEYGPMGVYILDACLAARIPLVVHFHGYDAYREDTVLSKYRTLYRRMFLAASAIIAVSRDMEQQLLGLGAWPETIQYNPYGVDSKLFELATPEINPPLFVAVGRFVDKKAPQLTLLAFHQVIQVCPEARLIMIGDGILWEASKDIAAALGLTQQVEFPGSLPHHEVAVTMQRARAFVQHSVQTSCGDSEGTPVAVLEAGMSGLPVISTRHAGIKDVVIEGKTGFLVDERDVDGMAKHMLRLAQDPDLAGRMGQQAREHIAASYSMDQHIERLMCILTKCHGMNSHDAA